MQSPRRTLCRPISRFLILGYPFVGRSAVLSPLTGFVSPAPNISSWPGTTYGLQGAATMVASSAESIALPPPVISQFLKTSTAVGLVVLSSLQHSVRRSHTMSVIPISSAFSGLGGRPPEITACTTSAILHVKKGRLPVNTWYTAIPRAYTSASLDETPSRRPNLLGRRSSGAMKDVVPCSLLDIFTENVITRVIPKSASMTRGGVESEMMMFGWDREKATIESLARARGLTALMSPCAMPQLWRYLTLLTTPKSYAATRGEVNYYLVLGEHLNLPDVTDLYQGSSPDTR